MALAKDSFHQEPLTEEQEITVTEVEALIDGELTGNYICEGISVHVVRWQRKFDKRCMAEIARRYKAAGWRFGWYYDFKDGQLFATLD